MPLCFCFTDVLLDSTEPGEGIDFQHQAGPSTSSLFENCVTPTLLSDKEKTPTLLSDKEKTPTLLSDKEKAPTLLSDKEKTPTLLSDKENYVKMVKSLDPVLNPVNRSPLSELLVYPTCVKKKTQAKNM